MVYYLEINQRFLFIFSLNSRENNTHKGKNSIDYYDREPLRTNVHTVIHETHI